MPLYVADQLSHPPPPNPPIGYGKIHRVTTTPSSDLGNDGDAAIDMNTGAVWEKSGGAWALVTGIAGTGVSGFAGNYGGVPPSVTPTTSIAIAFDKDTGTTWQWYDSAWH